MTATIEAASRPSRTARAQGQTSSSKDALAASSGGSGKAQAVVPSELLCWLRAAGVAENEGGVPEQAWEEGLLLGQQLQTHLPHLLGLQVHGAVRLLGHL